MTNKNTIIGVHGKCWNHILLGWNRLPGRGEGNGLLESITPTIRQLRTDSK